MALVREQRCDHCGEPLGAFAWSQREDGPLVCGASDCAKWEREVLAEEREQARERAEEDGFSLYGGRS